MIKVNIEQLINRKNIVIKSDNDVEVKTFANNGRRFKIVNDENGKFKVIDFDGFAMGQGASVKGAVIGALICGVPLREINFNGYYVPVRECLEVVK